MLPPKFIDSWTHCSIARRVRRQSPWNALARDIGNGRGHELSLVLLEAMCSCFEVNETTCAQERVSQIVQHLALDHFYNVIVEALSTSIARVAVLASRTRLR